MKLFTNEQIRAIDRYTIETEGVAPAELIERVAEGIVDEITARWRPTKPTIIFAGPGNNGADALATARLLVAEGFAPQVYLFNIGGNKLSADCSAARDHLLATVPGLDFHEVTTSFKPPELNSNYLIIDGLFGSGLREELQGGFKALVQYINEENATVVSIDLPSGMFSDWNPQLVNRNTIHATLTLAIQYPRICFFLPDNADLIGEWKVIDIGLSEKAAAQTPVEFCLIEKRDVHRRLRHRKEFASKADFGSAVLYAGSYGMMCAAVLAARGAMRAGVGKLTVTAPKCGYSILQTAVPEAMYRHNRGELNIVEIHPDRDFSAIAAGPGMGTNEMTVKALEDFLAAINQPVILDADALNCMAKRPSLLDVIPPKTVITPHVGEFDRLFGENRSSEERLKKAIEMAKFYNIIIVLKGHYTATVRPTGTVYFNSTGNPGMATAGAGDVLTGVIAAFMAQGYCPEHAATIGVYVHGLAGDLAASELGEFGMTATDIASNVGRAIRIIENRERIPSDLQL